VNILFIDNFDSFTYNLVEEFKRNQCQIMVYRNNIKLDELNKIIQNFHPSLIVIGPGPSTPENAGVCLELIKIYYSKIPIFGVCLGHQCIIKAFNGTIKKCRRPVHGKPSQVIHDNRGIFQNIRNPFQAGRYHSLIAENIPADFVISATTDDKIVMAIRHKKYNLIGVQFHPESILTPVGSIIIKNLLKLVDKMNIQ